MLNRRQFLWTSLAAPAVIAAQKRPAPVLSLDFADIVQLSEGVYVTLSKARQATSNGGLIVGRDAVLIVEGHFFPEAAALEIEAARMLSKAPIRGAVNTHYHLDHSFGNSAYQQENIPILAHRSAPALMKERYAALQGVDKTALLAPLQQKIGASTDPTEKQHLTMDLGALQWMYQAIDRVTLAYPTELLADSVFPHKIDLGGITVVLEHVTGHTPTDVMVRVPDREVVFTGDVVFEKSYPVAFDCNMAAWRKALDHIAGFGRRTKVVPGHGPLCGPGEVHEFADLVDDLHQHADKMRRSGVPVDEAIRRYTVPPRFMSFGMFSWDWAIGGSMRNYFFHSKPV